LRAKADDRLSLLIARLQAHDAIGGMVLEPEDESPVIASGDLMRPVEAHGGPARRGQAPGDAQLAAGNHGLIDDNVRRGGEAAQAQR
jgi:hypothetical protein